MKGAVSQGSGVWCRLCFYGLGVEGLGCRGSDLFCTGTRFRVFGFGCRVEGVLCGVYNLRVYASRGYGTLFAVPARTQAPERLPKPGCATSECNALVQTNSKLKLTGININ